jgi:hypothetical protein
MRLSGRDAGFGGGENVQPFFPPRKVSLSFGRSMVYSVGARFTRGNFVFFEKRIHDSEKEF